MASSRVPNEPVRKVGSPLHPVYVLIRGWFRIFLTIYTRCKVTGLENVPATGPCLILSNHTSHLDPPIIGSVLRREVHSMGRDDLFRIPLIGWIIRRLNAHPIRRGTIDREAIKQADAILMEGHALLIFPEGTRSPDGKLAPALGGFGMILEGLDQEIPCVPLLLVGVHRALGKGMIFPRPVAVEARFGKPFIIAAKGEKEPRRDYYDRCAARIQEQWQILLGES